MSGELNTTPTGECGTLDDVDARPVMPLHVAVACGEVRGTAAVEVARDRQRFEEYLGHDDGAAEIQHDAPVMQIGQRAGEAFEIAVTGGAECGAVGAGMLVNDFSPDSRMHGHRHTQLRTGEQHRYIAAGQMLTRSQI